MLEYGDDTDNPRGQMQRRMAGFVARVRRSWFIPMSAYTMRGHVVIQFNIHRNGTITDVAVVQPSSIDVKVGNLFRVFRNHTAGVIDVKLDLIFGAISTGLPIVCEALSLPEYWRRLREGTLTFAGDGGDQDEGDAKSMHR